MRPASADASISADSARSVTASFGNGASGPFLLTKHRSTVEFRRTARQSPEGEPDPEMIDFTGQTAIVTGAGR